MNLFPHISKFPLDTSRPIQSSNHVTQAHPMIEETIQKLTASIEALTVQIAAHTKVSADCVALLQARQKAESCCPAPGTTYDSSMDSARKVPAVEAKVAETAITSTPAAESDKPAQSPSIKRLKAKAAAEIAAAAEAAKAPESAPAAETTKPATPAPAEVKHPEQAAVIDIAGQLLTATNQNDGGFLRGLAKELGLDKLRNAKPEQRQGIIDRINAEINRVKESAV